MRKNGGVLEHFLKSLLVATFAAVVAFTPAHADDVCRNLWNPDTAVVGHFDADGNAGDSTNYVRNTTGIPVTPGQQIKTITPIYTQHWVVATKSDGTFIERVQVNIGPDGTYRAPAGADLVYLFFGGSGMVLTPSDNIMVTKDTTATAYQPYNPLCATCDGTVVSYETVAAADVPAGVQNGTPSPENPIEPVFYTQGDMVLRRIGDYADSYDASTGKITRRVGVKVLNGTENWDYGTIRLAGYRFPRNVSFFGSSLPSPSVWYCTHYLTRNDSAYNTPGYATRFNGTTSQGMFSFAEEDLGITSSATDAQATAAFKTWLAQQYDAGTPVTVYYPLPESKWYTEDWVASYCHHPIKIATTAYNNNAFSSVQTALNSAVDTIKTVVANTITQTAAIAQIASDKQTRPSSGCPTGKTCLLVEDMNGEPHWYEIIEEYIPPEPEGPEPTPVTP